MSCLPCFWYRPTKKVDLLIFETVINWINQILIYRKNANASLVSENILKYLTTLQFRITQFSFQKILVLMVTNAIAARLNARKKHAFNYWSKLLFNAALTPGTNCSGK